MSRRKKRDPWAELKRVSRRLRAVGGCPWDRKQTFSSLRPYVIEEAYEVVECLEREAWGDLKEELGDLLYQVFFLSQIAWEKKWFDVDDVAGALSSKLIRRHPHVFRQGRLRPLRSASPSVAATAEDGPGTRSRILMGFPPRTANQVLKQWARTKAREGNGRSVMASVPRAMPALMRARRVSEKAARLGFDWKDSKGVLKKVKEEFGELEHELKRKNRRRTEEELGDLFFTLINLGRFMGVDGESALHGTVNRFVQRFQYMETEARRLGFNISELKANDWEKLWMKAKKFSTEKVDRL